MATQAQKAVAALSFPQKQRLQYIESVAFWEGSVQRQRVCDVFGVSPNHITKDLRLYRAISPRNLDYDVSARTYRPTKRFRPIISSGQPEEYLSLLRLSLETEDVVGVPALDPDIAVTATPSPRWPADPQPLRRVIKALREGIGVRVLYQSLRAPEPSERVLWPHALVFAGVRWHVRAFDSKRKEFRDFVLPRIIEAEVQTKAAPKKPTEDKAWSAYQTIEVVPNPKWGKSQQAAIAREYGMKQMAHGWCWSVSLRQCLVPYFLRAHNLSKPLATSLVIARNLADLKSLAFEDVEN